MFTDDELLPISALQHYVFCPRRAALVHVERIWAENRFTAEGRLLHRRADDPQKSESRPGVRVARGLELRSYRYGLGGKADVVEFHERPAAGRPGNKQQPKAPSPPAPLPVDGARGDSGPAATTAYDVVLIEYKRGRPKPGRNDEFRVQLCGQAFCLEEMLDVRLDSGQIFFGKTRRRVEVAFDDQLRRRTIDTIDKLHELIRSGTTPTARFESKCRRCSLLHLCLPKAMRPRATASRYLADAIVGPVEPSAESEKTP